MQRHRVILVLLGSSKRWMPWGGGTELEASLLPALSGSVQGHGAPARRRLGPKPCAQAASL